MRTCSRCGRLFAPQRRSWNRTRCDGCRDAVADRRATVADALSAGASVEDAAREVGTHPDTVRRWLREGVITVRPRPADTGPPASWRDDALCANHSRPWLWDGETRDDVAAARKVCARCPVTDACWAEAARVDAAHGATGVWAGMTAQERAWARRSVPPPPRLTGDALYRAAMDERYDPARLAEESA